MNDLTTTVCVPVANVLVSLFLLTFICVFIDSSKSTERRAVHASTYVDVNQSALLKYLMTFFFRDSGIFSANSIDLDIYSPTRNFLINRQVPVPLNSFYQQSQPNAELEQLYTEISSVPSHLTSIQVNLQSSVTLEQMLSMPIFPLVTSTAAVILSDSSNQSPEDANSISESTNKVLVGTSVNNSENRR